MLERSRERDAVHLGVLGGALHGGDPSRLEVTGLLELEYTGRLETAYRHLRLAVDAVLERGEQPAGLFVAYRDSGGRLEAEVARLHLSLFNQPGQVAVVLDPESAEIGMYVRDREGRFRSVTFDSSVDIDEPRANDAE